jgi:hypothetical protein
VLEIFMAAFSMCRRQSGVIRNGEVANFARNKNNFDVCTQHRAAIRRVWQAATKTFPIQLQTGCGSVTTVFEIKNR